jgi:hypothetical protein
MARIALTQAGAALGRRLLPQSFQFLGRRISGASLGRRLGSLAGDALENALSPPREGPRLETLHVMEAREGAGIANVYGRMRVAGHVIWAGDFTENRQTSGGKVGPRVNTYSYSLSFAVGICEGPNARIERVWANGEPLQTGRIVMRQYPGSEDQLPDPALEAELGTGATPAFRGLCYVVFEDFPLEDFGNRVPNLSFEVVRTPAATAGDRVADQVEAINIIPATGEFVYAAEPVNTRSFPGIEKAMNVHTPDGRADFVVSLDQLQAELPNVSAVSLTVAWFGDDLRAGHCSVRPGVETRERETVPLVWRAGDVSRQEAQLISQTPSGHAYYGGTPSDNAVLQGLREIQSRGLDVTLTPFLLMDIPPDNPQGQPAFPWRGRISSIKDGTADARNDVDAFMGDALASDFRIEDDRVIYTGPADDWGYRRFILHMAWLAKASGACAGFLVGTEMRDLTRTRDGEGRFPFVEGLVSLAGEVKSVLGAGCNVSYAADWSEYGAFVPSDGSNDVLFPLDPLWASADIDFVGIDWYPPAGDWRDGDQHADHLAGFSSPAERSYILANQQGGEGYDWYYPTEQARENQSRLPIVDTAHGEDWVFRSKDVENWWSQPHHERPGGVRNASPTAWVPGSKPLRLSEIGFPAVDKGTNSPNLFYDPKSSESALPPFSNGARDDVLQASALTVALAHWQAKPMIEQAVVWAWDGRPFPAYPSLQSVWSDGENWSYGHWLNGRTGLTSLPLVLQDLARRAGVGLRTDDLLGVVEGLAMAGVMELEAAIEPLVTSHSLNVLEDDGEITIQHGDPDVVACQISDDGLVAPLSQRRDLARPLAGKMRLAFSSIASDFDVAIAEARNPDGDPRQVVAAELPLALSEPEAERIAAALLVRVNQLNTAQVTLPGLRAHIAPGAVVSVDGESWQVEEVERGLEDTLALRRPVFSGPGLQGVSAPWVAAVTTTPLEPDLLVIDGPRLKSGDGPSVHVAVFAQPWPGGFDVSSGVEGGPTQRRVRIERAAMTGRLQSGLSPGVLHRWDEAQNVVVQFGVEGLSSASRLAVLSGQNRLLIEAQNGWECIGFRNAELLAEHTYRLSGLLRGLDFTEAAAREPKAAGARCVFVDDTLTAVSMTADEVAVEGIWQVEGHASQVRLEFEDRARQPLAPAHAVWNSLTGLASWVPRDQSITDNWEAPDPDPALHYQVQWTDEVGELHEETASTAQLALGGSFLSGEVRSLAPSGRTSDWVPIRPI